MPNNWTGVRPCRESLAPLGKNTKMLAALMALGGSHAEGALMPRTDLHRCGH